MHHKRLETGLPRTLWVLLGEFILSMRWSH